MGQKCHSKSMLIILLLWLRAKMLDGPVDQTALRKGGQLVFIANAEMLQGKAEARSSSSCLGLKDKKSGLEALALKQSLVDCDTMCHSAAQLGDVVKRDSDTARAPWELFVGFFSTVSRGFKFGIVYQFPPKTRTDGDDIAADVSGDPKNVTLIT